MKIRIRREVKYPFFPHGLSVEKGPVETAFTLTYIFRDHSGRPGIHYGYNLHEKKFDALEEARANKKVIIERRDSIKVTIYSSWFKKVDTNDI